MRTAEIVEREASAYLLVPRKVMIPFGADIDAAMGELFGTMDAHGIQPLGPVFFKYDVIRMPELEMGFGILVPAGTPAVGSLQAGELPAGRYVRHLHIGPYDDLIDATGWVLRWVKERGLELDKTDAADGEHFAARFEMYLTDPATQPDPSKHETEIWMKLRD